MLQPANVLGLVVTAIVWSRSKTVSVCEVNRASILRLVGTSVYPSRVEDQLPHGYNLASLVPQLFDRNLMLGLTMNLFGLMSGVYADILLTRQAAAAASS